MSTAATSSPPPDRPADQDVRAELECILESPAFRASDRRKQLLRYIVEACLDGSADALKGYTIAVEVLGRDEDFDPQTDPIVRLETSRLRRDLELYYLSEGKDDPVVVSIPKGGSVPAFSWQAPVSAPASEPAAPPATRAPSRARYAPAWAAALVVVGLIGAAMTFFRAPADVVPPTYESVGVLPFHNLSGSPEQQYLADGITEAITNALGQFDALKVISRTSMTRYRETTQPAPTIAQELDVAALVEGSVARSEDRVRITVQLIDAAEDEQIWSRVFERNVEDVLTLQNEVAVEIATGINAAVLPRELHDVAPKAAAHPDAYESYLRGRFLLQKRTPASTRTAIRNFERAIELEPDMARAYAGLSEAYVILRFAAPFPEALPSKAAAAAAKAVELAPGLPDAHVALGYAKMHQLEWPEAESAFSRALELEPSSARTHFAYARFLNFVGRWEEALEELRIAKELDPLSLDVHVRIAQTLFMLGESEQAAEPCMQAKRIDPTHAGAHHCLGMVSLWRGDYDEAIELISHGVELSQRSPWNLSILGMAYGKAGRANEVAAIQKELTELSNDHHRVEMEMAITHIGLGETEQALDWLEKAYERRDVGIAGIRSRPLFQDLRAEPRFQALLARLDASERRQDTR